MARLILFFALLLFPVSLMAQDAAAPEEEEIRGEGARGRFTEEQSAAIALARLPGEIIATSGERLDGVFYYEFEILRPDGSVFEVEVDAALGEVYEIEIVSLGADPVLPYDLFPESLAEDAARKHVAEKTKGAGKPELVFFELGVLNRKPAYFYRYKRAIRTYEVIVDALDGKIESVREVKG